MASLRSLGLNANFATKGRRETLEEQINLGRPVDVGWRHRSLATAPGGGCHWSVVIGVTAFAAIENKPNGEALLGVGNDVSARRLNLVG